MGAGKKKKNEAFAVAPAIDVAAPTNTSSQSVCNNCGAHSPVNVKYTIGSAKLSTALCKSCLSDSFGVENHLYVDSTGTAYPSIVLSSMSKKSKDDLTPISLTTFSSVMSGGFAEESLEKMQKIVAHLKVSEMAETFPGTLTALYGPFPGDLDGVQDNSAAYGSLELPDGTAVVLLGKANGNWEWIHYDYANNTVLDGGDTYFSSPEKAFEGFLGNAMSGIVPLPMTLSEDNGTFKVTGPWPGTGFTSVTPQGDGTSAWVVKVNDEVIASGVSANNVEATKDSIDAAKAGVGRCAACGQFVSLANTGSHTCPTKKTKKAAPQVPKAQPQETVAAAVTASGAVVGITLDGEQDPDADSLHVTCEDCGHEGNYEDGDFIIEEYGGIYCVDCYYDNGHDVEDNPLYDPQANTESSTEDTITSAATVVTPTSPNTFNCEECNGEFSVDEAYNDDDGRFLCHSCLVATGHGEAEDYEDEEDELESLPDEPIGDVATIIHTAEIEQVAGSELAGQEAIDYHEAHATEAVTPIPEAGELVIGDGIGKHLILGGSDFYDSAVTVIAYQDPDKKIGQRQILFTEVTAEAEQKILDAMSGDDKMVEKTVTYTDTGRIPLDTDNNVYEDILAASKSVNFHLKEQDEIPEHTLQTIANLQQRIQDIEADADADPAAVAMAAHYKTAIDNLVAWRDDWEAKKAAFAASGGTDGKLPKATEFTAEFTATKTEMVPASGSSGLPTSVEPASGVNPKLSADGVSTWDGSMGASIGNGSQYKIDLGDGYVAYYRPHNGDHLKYGAPQTGTRGQLEIVAPPGQDNPRELVRTLHRLNLGSEPLTHAETEWSYLNANIFAQGIAGRAQVKAARAASEAVISAKAEIITATRVGELAGLAPDEIEGWVRQIRLQAEKESLPERTALLRDAVAAVTGHGTGIALLKSSAYKPSPVMTRAGVKWRRFDVTPEEIDKAWGAAGRGLHHEIHGTSDRILDVLRSGSLASQVRRRRMGVASNTGWSETKDVTTGGSRSVFLRNASTSAGTFHGSTGLYWGTPSALLTRTDWYANKTDGYGKMTTARHPLKVIGFQKSNNELMFSDGIDIYGPEGPTAILLPKHLRQQALDIVKSKGITEVNGIPIEKWIP